MAAGLHVLIEAVAEDRQMATVGAAEEGEHRGGDHGDAEEPGHDPVGRLDDRVRFQRRVLAGAVALRPVRTPKAGVGEPDRCAGEDDQGEADQRHRRHLCVALRRDLEAIAERREHIQMFTEATSRPPELIFSRRFR